MWETMEGRKKTHVRCKGKKVAVPRFLAHRPRRPSFRVSTLAHALTMGTIPRKKARETFSRLSCLKPVLPKALSEITGDAFPVITNAATEQKGVVRDSRRKYLGVGNPLAIVLALHLATKWRHTRDNLGAPVL